MDAVKRDFITKCSVAARMIGHPFPDAVGSEAAEESDYGTSRLAIEANNLFGLKIHQHNQYGQIALPTREYLGSGWTVVNAYFEQYSALEDCFLDRLNTLTRLKQVIPHYKAALEANSAEDYLVNVSESWSTDPGWQCSCGAKFLLEADARNHANAGGVNHSLQLVPGLGRGLKVIAILHAYVDESQ